MGQFIIAHLGTEGIHVDEVLEVSRKPDVKKVEKKLGTDQDIQEVEARVPDMTRQELGEAIRYFSMDALTQMAKNAEVNTWDRLSNVPIRKMRLIMEIKEAYFPTKTPKPKIPTSPWVGLSVERLEKKAIELGVKWNYEINQNINRMRIIMALKKAGVQADEID